MNHNENITTINFDKGYVIKYVDEFTGKAMYHGANHKMSPVKDSIREKDTYTRAGAMKALDNYLRIHPDSGFYSIDKISSHFCNCDEATMPTNDKKMHIISDIDDALNRLDELWDNNDFHKGDKMRINEVRSTLSRVKGYLIENK